MAQNRNFTGDRTGCTRRFTCIFTIIRRSDSSVFRSGICLTTAADK